MKRITAKQAQEKAVALLGPMGHAKVNKKTAPGSRYQIGLMDTEGVLVDEDFESIEGIVNKLEKPGPVFKRIAAGRDFGEALQAAEALLKEMQP